RTIIQVSDRRGNLSLFVPSTAKAVLCQILSFLLRCLQNHFRIAFGVFPWQSGGSGSRFTEEQVADFRNRWDRSSAPTDRPLFLVVQTRMKSRNPKSFFDEHVLLSS